MKYRFWNTYESIVIWIRKFNIIISSERRSRILFARLRSVNSHRIFPLEFKPCVKFSNAVKSDLSVVDLSFQYFLMPGSSAQSGYVEEILSMFANNMCRLCSRDWRRMISSGPSFIDA